MIYRRAQVGDFGRVGSYGIKIANEIFVGGSDQGKILGKRQREYDAPVRGL